MAKKICQKTFADYAMFQNSGAEARGSNKSIRRYFILLENRVKIEFYV